MNLKTSPKKNAATANKKSHSSHHLQPRRLVKNQKSNAPTKIILFNKPFNTLTQFTGEPSDSTLADFIAIKHVYPAGRLDKDSEGLLVLTNDGILQARLTQPTSRSPKIYWVQVEGIPEESSLTLLRNGIELKDGKTLPAGVCVIADPDLWPRNPPIRQRACIPTTWLSITLIEGKNRQVRRMTAAIGHPTLRLVRYQVANWTVEGLKPGEWKEVFLEENDMKKKDVFKHVI